MTTNKIIIRTRRIRLWQVGFLFCCFCISPIYAEQPVEKLTLSQSVQLALEKNEGILASKESVKQAEAGVTIARAGFLPKITAKASYTKLAESPAFNMETPGPGYVPVFGDSMGIPIPDTIGWTIGMVDRVNTLKTSFKMGENENYLAGVSLQQPIFTFGKILQGYQIAQLNLNSVKQDFQKQKNEIVFQVKQTFYTILASEELVKLTAEAYEQIKKHTKVVEQRYNEGLSSKFDLLRAKVQLANMEPQLLKAKNGLDITTTGFKILIGLSQDTPIELEGELKYESTEVNLEGSINKAQVNRPEIKALSFRKQMAGKALTITKTSNLPNIVFIANYDYKKPVYFDPEWGEDWNLTVDLQMPIFTGFETWGKIRGVSSQLSQAEHGLKFLKEGIEMEVRTVYLQLQEAQKLLESQKDNIAQAEEALRIIEERYKTGLATSLEVMDTQLALTQAKTNQLQALSDYLIAEAKLEKVIGKETK